MIPTEGQSALREIERLPRAYREFAESLEDVLQVCDPANAGVVWRLRGLGTSGSLLEGVRLSGVRSPFVFLIRRLLLDSVPPGSTRRVAGVHGRSHPADLIRGAFSVGENGSDILFLDEDGAVWAFWYATETIECLGHDFREWLSKATSTLTGGQTALPSGADQLIGRWTPVNSPTLSAQVISRMGVIEIGVGGLWRMHRSSGVRDFQWRVTSARPLQLVVDTDRGPMQYQVVSVGGTSLVLAGPNSATQVSYEREGGGGHAG